jgi:phage baseplate assembly protein V
MDDNSVTRLWRRVQLSIGRGRITAVDDSKTAQLLQVQMGALETRDKTPRIAEYGLASYPPLSSEVVVVFLGGDHSNGVAIASNHQGSRPTNLQEGEVMLYDVLGRQIYFSKDGGIVIEAKDTAVTINHATSITINASQGVTLHGDLHVQGAISASGDVSDGTRSMAADRGIYNQHNHSANGTSPPNPPQ